MIVIPLLSTTALSTFSLWHQTIQLKQPCLWLFSSLPVMPWCIRLLGQNVDQWSDYVCVDCCALPDKPFDSAIQILGCCTFEALPPPDCPPSSTLPPPRHHFLGHTCTMSPDGVLTLTTSLPLVPSGLHLVVIF